jgi:uncharacterized protein (TIGR02757 family)
MFKSREDIEISGFLSATIAWGNRKSIVQNARKLIALMDHSPYQFLMSAKPAEFKPFLNFVHRTFNGVDCLFFLHSLRNIYKVYGGLEPLFLKINRFGALQAILDFRSHFLETEHLARSAKHIANPGTGSAAKRINMFLRWMVRKDQCGVDFGIWKTIDQKNLICPLDVHSGTVARQLGLLQRKQNDWKAAEELTFALREFDPGDPVKYDFALFGIGMFEKNKI